MTNRSQKNDLSILDGDGAVGGGAGHDPEPARTKAGLPSAHERRSLGGVLLDPGQPYPLVWRVKTRLPERQGQACRVLVRGRMNSCLVEFEDGFQVVTSRNYVRKILLASRNLTGQ